MDLSGVIFVVLAVVWAVYLIPRALKHHDELARTRSVDEVSGSARLVGTPALRRESRAARRRRAKDADRVLAADAAGSSPAPATPVVPAPRQPVPTAAPAPAPRIPSPRVPSTAEAKATRRRRRILGALLLVLVAVGAASLLRALPGWAPAIPGLLVLSFLVLCRVLVRRDRAARDQRRTHAPATAAEAVAPAEEVPPVDAGEKPAPVEVPVPPPAVQGSLDDAASFRELVEDAVAPSVEDSPASGSLWDPLPVTLPTYVAKPRATRSVRTISLGDPGFSSSGRDAADSALVASAQLPPDAGDEGRRVVGG